MKDKTYKLNVALTIILTLSLIGNYLLFNRLSNTNQSLIELQTQLEKSSVQLQTAQTDWKALETNIATEQKKNSQVASAASKIPANPNKVLSSGLTLWEAKLTMEHDKKSLGSLANDKEFMEQMAKDYGTTLDELARVQDPSKVQTPTKPVQPTQPSKPSTTPSKGSGTTGGTTQKPSQPSKPAPTGKVTEWDKNGNGINDDLEAYTGTGEGGTTVEDPDFNPGTVDNN